MHLSPSITPNAFFPSWHCPHVLPSPMLSIVNFAPPFFMANSLGWQSAHFAPLARCLTCWKVTFPGELVSAGNVIGGGPEALTGFPAAAAGLKSWQSTQAGPGLCCALSPWHVRHRSRPSIFHPCGAWHAVQPASVCADFLCRPPTAGWQVAHFANGATCCSL